MLVPLCYVVREQRAVLLWEAGDAVCYSTIVQVKNVKESLCICRP